MNNVHPAIKPHHHAARMSLIHRGYEVEVEYEYWPAQRARYEGSLAGPAEPETAEIAEVWHKGEPVKEILADWFVKELAEQVLIQLGEA